MVKEIAHVEAIRANEYVAFGCDRLVTGQLSREAYGSPVNTGLPCPMALQSLTASRSPGAGLVCTS
jgi:hypothetical protein